MPERDPNDSRLATRNLATPVDLPPRPSLSYNPRSVGRYADDAGEDGEYTSAPTYIPLGTKESTESAEAELAREAAQAESLGFTLMRLIGRGGMGEVWEAIQRRLWRVVAVKRLRRRPGGSTIAETASMLRSFQGEAMTSALLDHPNIVPVYDLGLDEHGDPLLAMKMVRGKSWNRVLDEDFRTLPVDDHLGKHLPILVQVAQAVAFAHSRGIVHRDLKPSQVMIGEYGEVLLMDWGLAVMVGEPPELPREIAPQRIYPDLESADNPAGTPAYMAPEQTEATTVNIGPWTDTYLLGGVLYNILTCRRPHHGSTSDMAFRQASEGVVTPCSEAVPGRAMPEDLVELAMSAMRPVPTDRPTAREFIDGLQDHLTGAGRRRESAAITQQLLGEKLERSYAAFIGALSRLGSAQRLWPENPEVAGLLEATVEAYSKFALEEGDLTLARAQAERLSKKDRRAELLGEIDAAREKVRVQQRRVRQFAAAAFGLLTIVIAGSFYSMHILTEANERTSEQLTISEDAKRAEAIAKLDAQQELEKATLLLADSMMSQGRNEDAINELQKIPEENRQWEWGYLLTRALSDLWVIPFDYRAFSPSMEYALGWNRDGGFCLLRAESGEVLAHLGDADPAGLVATFSRDEKRFAVGFGEEPTRVYEVGRAEPLATIERRTSGTVTALEFSADAKQLVIGDSDGNAGVYGYDGFKHASFVKHGRGILNIFWGAESVVVASASALRREHPDGTESELLMASDAVMGFHRNVGSSSDNKREWFAYGYDNSILQYGRVDAGPLRSLPIGLTMVDFSEKMPWLVAAGSTTRDRVRIFDLESSEEVAWLPPEVLELDPNMMTTPINPPAIDVELSIDERSILVRSYGAFIHLSFPGMQRPEIGNQISYNEVAPIRLLPKGAAYWQGTKDGRTRIRAFGGAIGTHIPGRTNSFGNAKGEFTASLLDDRYEMRDTATGEVMYSGGALFQQYFGGRFTKDSRNIYITGHRQGKFIVEYGDVKENRLLATYLWEGPILWHTIDADAAMVLELEEGRQNTIVWDVSGPVQKKLYVRPAPAGDKFLYAEIFDNGTVCVQGTDKGQLVAWNGRTGEDIKSIQAHEGSIVIARTDGKNLVTVGADDHIKIWNPRTLELVNDLAFDFAPEGFKFSGDGKLVVAWPERGAPVVMDMKTHLVRAHLARTDLPIDAMQLLPGNARVVAISGEVARFYDTTTGRETFSIETGFGGISADGTKYLEKMIFYDGRLVEIAPSRVNDLPGDASMSYRDRLDLWAIARYRRWSVRELRGRVPDGLMHLALKQHLVSSPDAMDAAPEAGSVFGLRGNDLFHPKMKDVLRRLAQFSRSSDPRKRTREWYRWTWEFHRMVITHFPEMMNDTPGHAVIADSAATLVARRVADGVDHRVHDLTYLLFRTRPLENLGLAYEARGDRERAIKAYSLAAALRMANGMRPSLETEALERLGAEPVAPPPARIVLGPAASFPPMVREALEKTNPAETPEEAGRRADDAWAAFFEARDAYYAATPEMDWDAIVEEEFAAPEWQPLPAEMTLGDLARELQGMLEPVLFGATLEEASRAEEQRIDDVFAWKLQPAAAK